MEKRYCKKHGMANHYLTPKNYWKCSKCSAESVKRRRKKNKGRIG